MLERLGEGTDGAGLAAPPVAATSATRRSRRCRRASAASRDPACAYRRRAQRTAPTPPAFSGSSARRRTRNSSAGRRAVPEPAELALGADLQRGAAGRHRALISPPSGMASAKTSWTTSKSVAGRFDIHADLWVEVVAKEMPWLVVQMSRLRFGGIVQHRLPGTARGRGSPRPGRGRTGIHVGQVTVQFHNGGGVLWSSSARCTPSARARPGCSARECRCSGRSPTCCRPVRAQAAAGGLLHRGLPFGSGRRRRRPPGPARDAARDELRLRLPDGDLR